MNGPYSLERDRDFEYNTKIVYSEHIPVTNYFWAYDSVNENIIIKMIVFLKKILEKEPNNLEMRNFYTNFLEFLNDEKEPLF